MIKAVLFDFGGVLTEAGKSGAVAATVAKLCDRKPADIDINDLHERYVRGFITEAEYFAGINKRYPCANPITVESFVAESGEFYSKSEPVYELVAQLREHHIVTGLLSNVYEFGAKKLQADGLYDGFDPLILSYKEGLAKPDPELFERALERLKLPGNEVLFIDDQERFEEQAEHVGMHFIWAQAPEQIVADTKALFLRENKLELT